MQCASQTRFLSYVGLAPADGTGQQVITGLGGGRIGRCLLLPIIYWWMVLLHPEIFRLSAEKHCVTIRLLRFPLTI